MAATIQPPSIPRENKNDAARILYIKNVVNPIKNYAMASRRAGTVPNDTTTTGQILNTTTFLTWLSNDVDMNPTLAKSGNEKQPLIPLILKLICDYNSQGYHFPEALQGQARELLEKWEAENWGAPEPQATSEGVVTEVREEEDDLDHMNQGSGGSGSSGTLSPRRDSGRQGDARVHYPPAGHPIWGTSGIMHGLAKKTTPQGTLSTVLNDRYSSSKRDFKRYGHNGLTVGQWFPTRLSALFHGAVGSSQAGISGHTANGAFSIVVSGHYEDLDTDNGEVLYYSGSGSHDNTDPNNHAESTTGTKCLKASYYTGNPVRVVRSFTGKGIYSPIVGVRYDGLYKLISMRRPRNARGGLYEQFRLERIDGQISLEDCMRRPNGQEQRQYEQIGAKYW